MALIHEYIQIILFTRIHTVYTSFVFIVYNVIDY